MKTDANCDQRHSELGEVGGSEAGENSGKACEQERTGWVNGRQWVTGAAVLLMMMGVGEVRAQSQNESRSRETKNASCPEETVSLTLRGAIALARVTINQKAMTFIVDSAGTSMINSDRVTLPVVKQLRTGPVTVSRAEPLEQWNVVEAASVRVGKEEMRGVKLLSRSLQQLEEKLNTEVDGILGADVLTRWDTVSLDYKRKAMVLERMNCELPSELPSQSFQSEFGITRR